MANHNYGEGIRIVGDFVCETIPDSPTSVEKPASLGISEGVHVIGEFVLDLATNPQDGVEEDRQKEGHRQ
jgi:hypothetical protein